MYEVVHNPKDMEKIILDESYLETILEYESRYLYDSKLCMRSSKEDIIKCLSQHESCGFLDNGKLVSYTLMYHNEYNVFFVDKCFTLPDYRQQGLNTLTLSTCVGIAIYNFDAVSVYSMCSPDNVTSLCNFVKCGFNQVSRIGLDASFHERFILERRAK